MKQKDKPMVVCNDFKPNPFYYNSVACLFCFEELCDNWVNGKRVCTDLDPSAGSTYRIEPGHCNLKKHKKIEDNTIMKRVVL